MNTPPDAIETSRDSADPAARPVPPAPKSGRIRVVHIVDCLGMGGMERGIAKLITSATADFEHMVIVQRKMGPLAKALPPGTYVTAMNKPEGNSPRYLWRLSRTLRRLAPDVVHTRNWVGMDGILAARLGGIRRVVHGEHGWYAHDPKGERLKGRLVRRVLSAFVREFTCVSMDLARWLRDRVGIRRPINQVYTGVDSAVFCPRTGTSAVREELGIPEGDFVAGIVGRLDPIKDHATLFSAFARIRASHPRVHLLVVGAGPEMDRLAGLATEGIRLLGERPDIPQLLQAMDVFCLVSRNEGISNTILEAMSAGVPVVASAVGGNPELVADGATGRLFPQGDVDALEKTLRAYVSDPELRRRHGEAARARAIERYSIHAMVAGYEAVYRRVSGRAGV